MSKGVVPRQLILLNSGYYVTMGARVSIFFYYCYFNRDTQGEPLRRREAVMLLAINWIEILVINEAKNVNKHSPLYNCLLFI